MIDDAAVTAAYRWILGRAPENAAALAYHAGHPSAEALRATLLASGEFADLYRAFAPAPDAVAARGLPPALSVETSAEGEARAALLARVARSWAALGAAAPHWSVLTADAFRPEALAENRAAFDATVAEEGALIDRALARLEGFDAARAACVEIGCGVGRATRALATRFARVLSVDVSAEHLAIAEREIAAAGARGVTLRRVARVEDYATLWPADFFYSRLVLQHNPPPVQVEILRAALAGLRPGGAAAFQAVTHIEGYCYAVAADLRREDGEMEMHVLPQAALFGLLAEAGCRPVEIQQDDAAGPTARIRSHFVLARKP